MSALQWYDVGYGWILADVDADSDWIQDRGLVYAYRDRDGWHSLAYLCARGPESRPEVVRSEALSATRAELRALLARLETEEVVS